MLELKELTKADLFDGKRYLIFAKFENDKENKHFPLLATYRENTSGIYCENSYFESGYMYFEYPKNIIAVYEYPQINHLKNDKNNV